MRRLHLFEFNDQPWLPTVLRDGLRAYLAWLMGVARVPEVVAPHLLELVQRTGSRQVVDLCAGAGGPWRRLRPQVADLDVVLTDLYPSALEPAATTVGARAWPDPVDALAVPTELTGIRTLFNALHHFPPEQARAMLADAARARQPFLAVELVERRWHTILSSPFILLTVILASPFLKPFRPVWVLLSLLLVLPVVVAWDGFVSHLRGHTPDELRSMTEGLEDGYRLEVRLESQGPATITMLVGCPTDDPEEPGHSRQDEGVG